jgi:hypothetical protein
MRPKPTSPANDEFLEELRQLACLVSGESDLQVVEGAPGSGWNYIPDLRRISMDRQKLRSESYDCNRGLVLHECGHAAITRLIPLLREPGVKRAPIFAVINAVEDCRLETWLQTRFPGCRPWIREYNDILLATGFGAEGEKVQQETLLAHFIAGLLSRWWFGEAGISQNHHVRVLVERAWPHLQAICQAIPSGRLSLDEATRLYHAHPMSHRYAESALTEGREAWELEVRWCQLRMWDHFVNGILPIAESIYPRIRGNGLNPRLRRWLERWLVKHHVGPEPTQPHEPNPALTRLIQRLQPGGPGTRGPGPRRDEDSANRTAGFQHYQRCLKQQAAQIERLSRQILELLEPRTRPRWTGPHRVGNRLNLRSVYRSESDPDSIDRVWQRRLPPTQHDLSLSLLVDISTSIAGLKIEATVQAIVLLAEVCQGMHIPLAIYAFSTANHFEVILDSGEQLDAEAQSRIGNLITRPCGGTEIQPALETVRDRLATLTTTDNYLVLMSDGQHNDQENPKAAIQELQRRGVRVIGLGLGPTSDALLRFLPNSRVNLEPDQVAEEFIDILMNSAHVEPSS